MPKISNALNEINTLDSLAHRQTPATALHPLAKLLVTLAYVATLMSFGKYDLVSLVVMSLYIPWGFYFSQLSFTAALRRLRFILPLVCMVGLANPFFDEQVFTLGSITLKAGYISLLTLMLKGALAVLASYLLIATTTIEQICYALRLLHVPKLMVTQLLLTYRYLSLLLEQADTISQAYALRAPQETGIRYRVWGSLAGQLLLRSIDRANALYASMLLRGFNGEFFYRGPITAWQQRDWHYLIILLLCFILLRLLPMSQLFIHITGGHLQ